MTEQERIESIKKNGGQHLKNFKRENITYAMCLEAVSIDGNALYYVPDEFKDKTIYEAACSSTGHVIQFVPKEFITKKLCESAVQSNGLALEFVPTKYKTYKTCLLAACNTSQALKFAPAELITAKLLTDVIKKTSYNAIVSLPENYKKTPLYLELVQVFPDLIWLIPKKNRTAKLCNLAIQKWGYKSLIDAIKTDAKIFGLLNESLYAPDVCLEFVKSEYFQNLIRQPVGQRMLGYLGDVENPTLSTYTPQEFTFRLDKIFISSEICELVVQISWRMLEFVPETYKTENVCFLSVKADGRSFEYVPQKYRTKEFCDFAFEQYKWNLDKIPNEYITYEMCLEAVRESGFLIEDVPLEFRTKEVCKISLMDENRYFRCVPTEILDKELCLLAFAHKDYSVKLKFIPEHLRDYDVCLAAVGNHGDDIEFVPRELITYEMCLKAVQETSWAAKYIPKEFFTVELAGYIVEHSGYEVKHIPKHCLTEEVCIKAISRGDRFAGTALRDIPDDVKTLKMCELAVEISPWSLQYVPEELVTEEMLRTVTRMACGRLTDNFPERFRTEEFINSLIEIDPHCANYLLKYLK